MTTSDLDLDALCQVVWYFRPQESIARKPGSFSENLIRAFAHADQRNHAILARAYPSHGYGMALAQGHFVTNDGMADLIDLCHTLSSK